MIAVFKGPCFIYPSKDHPLNKRIALENRIYKILELNNLVNISLKLLCLNSRKNKIDDKTNGLSIVLFCYMWQNFVVLHEALVSWKEKCQLWELIDYLSYLTFSIHILTQCMFPQNAVCYIQADFCILPK